MGLAVRHQQGVSCRCPLLKGGVLIWALPGRWRPRRCWSQARCKLFLNGLSQLLNAFVRWDGNPVWSMETDRLGDGLPPGTSAPKRRRPLGRYHDTKIILLWQWASEIVHNVTITQVAHPCMGVTSLN